MWHAGTDNASEVQAPIFFADILMSYKQLEWFHFNDDSNYNQEESLWQAIYENVEIEGVPIWKFTNLIIFCTGHRLDTCTVGLALTSNIGDKIEYSKAINPQTDKATYKMTFGQ